ncbi:hypothetical protein FDECE_2215 [Fusarium decemcellulare]|nr:hypothetical protein FDECE_2215 [Fusarium decemcellulare]
MLFTKLWKTTVLLHTAPLVTAERDEQRIMHPASNDMAWVRRKLADAEIIPTVIDDFTPILGLRASWEHDSASLGNTLQPSHLQSAPSIHLEKPDPESQSAGETTSSVNYVLALTDPDAPSRDNPKWSEFCHWIATGVSAPSSSEISTLEVKDVIEYKPPGPPAKTGKHRYVFLAFTPANGTTEELHPTKPAARKHWGSNDEGYYGVREWAHENQLVPVAANFIYAQNEKQE